MVVKVFLCVYISEILREKMNEMRNFVKLKFKEEKIYVFWNKKRKFIKIRKNFKNYTY
jgi:hypothetical protein